MSEQAEIAEDLRTRILQEPDVILEDPAVMRALISANERALGGNIVDLRGIAMERLEARLGRLEDTHKSVIAAAYENLAGTNQVHRAILAFLEPVEFEEFLACLGSDVADILRVNKVKLVLESHQEEGAPALGRVGDVLSIGEPGFIDDYIAQGRTTPVRQVTLRAVHPEAGGLYVEGVDWIHSEACLKLDFGPDCLPGLLAMGSEDPQHFTPNHGTDLLAFLGSVFERAMRRWLA